MEKKLESGFQSTAYGIYLKIMPCIVSLTRVY
jgi:hypothetical protein